MQALRKACGNPKDSASPCLLVDCDAASSALAQAPALRGDARGYQLPAKADWADIKARPIICRKTSTRSRRWGTGVIEFADGDGAEIKNRAPWSNLLKKQNETASESSRT